MKTKRAVLIEPGRFELSETEMNPNADQLLIKIESCGLCNWELNHWRGQFGKFPQTLGHEGVGIVTAIGKNVKGFKEGDRVTGLFFGSYCFSEYALIQKNFCFKLNETVNLKYALGEPLKCVVTVLRGTQPEAGDYGVIMGCGPMGLWCIQALSGNFLSALIAIDIDPNKLKLAEKFGATHVINSKDEDVDKKISEITNGAMADFVIEGTGIPSLLNTSIGYIRRSGKGRLVLMSSHETSCKEFDFRGAIDRSIQIIVPHSMYSSSQADDMRRAANYLNNGVFKMEELITHSFSLDHIQEAFETLENKPAGYIKGIVMP